MSEADLAAGRIYPPMKQIQNVSVKIAVDISKYYYKTGVASLYPVPSCLESYIRDQLYDTTYQSYVPHTWTWPEEHTIPKNYDQVN